MTDDDRTRDEGAEDPGHVWPEPPTEEAPTREEPPPGPAAAGGRAPGGARRLLRSRDDRVIAGVAGGLGRYFDVDPVIVRIGFAITILFGGVGLIAYLAAAIFVPADDGTGSAVAGGRGRGIGRVLGIGLLVLVALWGLGALAVGAAFVTAIGYGLAVVAAIVLIGVALVALSFRGGARWLLAPALALAVGAGVASAADLDLEGGIGQRDYRPSSAAALPDDGYDLGVGQLNVDLRDIDWSPERAVHLAVDIGAGQTQIAVPPEVCVVADAHAGAGRIELAGQSAEGIDVEASTGEGSRATPQLVLDAEVEFGEIRVFNDDDVEIGGGNRPGFDHGQYLPPGETLRDANAEACAA